MHHIAACEKLLFLVIPGNYSWLKAVRKKTADSHMALRGNISAPVQVTNLIEASKDAASLVVCTQKNFFFLEDAGFFVSDIISGGLLGHLGSLCLALGVNR